MDFKSLYCFAELIRLQSFSATASALNLTQPTVSKIIQALEEELGVPLLCKENGRKKRQVQPTAIGEEVYRHALNLLHERDLLLARIDDYRHVKSGTLRLGLALFGSDLLSHALFDFHQKMAGHRIVVFWNKARSPSSNPCATTNSMPGSCSRRFTKTSTASRCATIRWWS